MSGEQQQPEPKAIPSQGAESSPAEQCDRLAETVDVVAAPSSPSTQEADATVLKADQSLQSTVDAPREASAATQRSAAATGMRYRILKPHAKGGLGEVFVARDQELNRDVALKEIRGEHAHNKDSRGRFLLEAEITGGLEHPGIVPVYGLGQYPDGRPYYAMRFIQGDSLKEAIGAYHSPTNAIAADSERTLQLRKLLGRFVDVCQAMSYAHSRGVLHRDLKPGNIMLGKYGETLVVDWGLAKLQGHDDLTSVDADHQLQPTSGESVTPTMAGSALGTPAYMPPEQAAGKLDQLGPASDVYSLGATLYHLLTGQAPFQGEKLEDTLKSVQQGTFPRPSEVNPGVPKPLEAVCLKAMALKPRDRYASPQDLADDIERYLADEPVQAFPEPFTQRAKRWVRKHPTLVTTTAAVVLLSAVGLGTFSSVLGAKNTQLSELNEELGERNTQLAKANADLDQANTNLMAANQREVEARELAQDNEHAAREQSQLALSTLTSVIGDLQEGFRDLPGGEEVRRQLLTTSLGKLEQVATEYVGQSAVDRHTTAALVELGDILMQFGRSDADDDVERFALPTDSSPEVRSSIELSRMVYERAHQLTLELTSANDATRIDELDLAVVAGRLGDVHLQLGQLPEASAYFENARVLFERLLSTDAVPVEAGEQHLWCIDRLGDVSLQSGDVQRALDFFHRSLAMREHLLESDPNNSELQRALSVSCTRLGDALMLNLQTSEALQFYQRAYEIRQSQTTAGAEPPGAIRDLGLACAKLGDVHVRLGQLQSALEYYQQSFDIRTQLAEREPNSIAARRTQALAARNLGEVHLVMGQTQEALACYTQMLELVEQTAAEDALNAEAQRDVSIAWGEVGTAHQQLGHVQEALDCYGRSLAISERLVEQNPEFWLAQRDVSVACIQLGDLLMAINAVPQASEYFKRAAEIRQDFISADPDNASLQSDLSNAIQKLGDVQIQMGEIEAGLDNYRQSLEICEKLAQDDKVNTEAQSTLAIALDRLGDTYLLLDQPESARPYFEKSFDIRMTLTGDAPENLNAQQHLAIAWDNLGDVERRLGDNAAALSAYRQSFAIYERLAELDSDNAEAKGGWATCCSKCGNIYLALSEHEQALECYEQGHQLSAELAQLDPSNPRVLRDYSVSFEKLGDVRFELQQYEQARILYAAALEIREELAAQYPSSALMLRSLSVALEKVADAELMLLEHDLAVEHFRASIEVLDRMIEAELNVEQSQSERLMLQGRLQVAEREAARADEATADWDTFISRRRSRTLLMLRIRLLTREQRLPEAAQTAEHLRQLDPENATNLYSAACGYALCAGAMVPAESESLSTEQQAQRREYIDLAFACLREAIAAGYSDFEELQQDPELAVLRELPEFLELLPMEVEQ